MENYPQQGFIHNPPPHSYESHSMIATILNELRELRGVIENSDEAQKKKIKSITDEIAGMRSDVRYLINPNSQVMETSLLPNLPFNTLDELGEFDTILVLEDELQKQLKNVILRVHGSDLGSFLRSAIKAVISDQLAVDITWRGTPEKPSINQFTCFRVIRDVCHIKYTDATDAEINKIVQQHFVHAKDRIKKDVINQRNKKLILDYIV